jgi:predicted cupin superfamily sugar epimerase
MDANAYVSHLQLKAHPEGGFYREVYRSEELIPITGLPPRFSGKRNFATAIYFLLEENNFSAFHKIKSDETWHFYAGNSLEVIEINDAGELFIHNIGNNLLAGDVFQYTVKAGHWFASRVKAGGKFSLVGCTVAPGFDFEDFEMPNRRTLLDQYPQHKDIITALTH